MSMDGMDGVSGSVSVQHTHLPAGMPNLCPGRLMMIPVTYPSVGLLSQTKPVEDRLSRD